MPPSPVREDGSPFQPRQWNESKLDEFREQLEYVDANGGVFKSPADRERTMCAWIGCEHTTMAMLRVENANGVWVVEICVDCGRQVGDAHCEHVLSSWHLDGRILICDNCGIDGT